MTRMAKIKGVAPEDAIQLANGEFLVPVETGRKDPASLAVPAEAVAAILKKLSSPDALWEHYSNDAATLDIAAPVMLAASKVLERIAKQA